MRLRMKRGDAARFGLFVTAIDPVTGAEVPVDVSGTVLRFTAKERIIDADLSAVITKTPTIIDGPGGQIEVRLVNADTSSRPAPSVLYWDAQMTKAGENTTLDSGLLYIDPDVTLA